MKQRIGVLILIVTSGCAVGDSVKFSGQTATTPTVTCTYNEARAYLPVSLITGGAFTDTNLDFYTKTISGSTCFGVENGAGDQLVAATLVYDGVSQFTIAGINGYFDDGGSLFNPLSWFPTGALPAATVSTQCVLHTLITTTLTGAFTGQIDGPPDNGLYINFTYTLQQNAC